MRDMKNRLPQEHVDMQFIALSISLLAFMALAYWAGDIVWIKDFQPFVTLISGIFAIFIGVLALLRYYTKRSSLNFLFIGIGFLAVGILDISEIILSSGGFNNLFVSSTAQIYPVTSVLSRSFLAVLLFVSWFVNRNEVKISRGRKRQETLLMSLVLISFLAFIGVFFLLVANGVVIDSLAVVVIGLISLMFLIFTLIGYLFNRSWLYDNFSYWLIFLLSFLLLSQIFYLPFFNLEYSNMMNLSVLAKFFAYSGLLIGFLNSIYELYQREINIQKELVKKNKQLDETKAKVEEAYLVLREEKWSLARSKGSVDKILKGIVKGK